MNVGGERQHNGWHTFTNSRWIWLLTIIVALGRRRASPPALLKFESPGAAWASIVAGLGALSTLLILYRIIHHPSGAARTFGRLPRLRTASRSASGWA